MSVTKKMILDLLEETQVGFSNAKTEASIKEKLIDEGYDDARLDELLEINTLLRTRYQSFENLSGLQMKATDKLMEVFQKEMQDYSTSRQISRKTFSDDRYRGLRSEFGLDQRIRTDFEGFIEQATQYYEAALKNQESFKEKRVLTTRLSNDKITAKLKGLEELKKFNTAQENAKGKANVAREERDSTFFELRMYWENFKIICRNIFRDNKEYLKILKIKPKKKPIKVVTPDESDTNEESETPGKNPPGANNDKPAPNSPTVNNDLNKPNADPVSNINPATQVTQPGNPSPQAASVNLNSKAANDAKDKQKKKK